MSEFMPIDAYRLLRRCAIVGKAHPDLNNLDEVTAAEYLVNRGFAEKDIAGGLTPTDAGRSFGRVVRPAH